MPPISALPPAAQGDYQLVETDEGSFWMSTADEVMRNYMTKSRIWEPVETQVFKSLLTPGCRVLDIGANVGYFSIVTGRNCPSATIHAVEPHPETAKLLNLNLWHNGVTASVWPVALGATSGTVGLEAAHNNVGDTRAHSVASMSTAQIVVPLIRGDDLFEGQAFDLMKLDVQGFELDVLIGFSGVIGRSPGLRVLMEYSLFDGVPSPDLKSVTALGFRILLIDKSGLRQAPIAELNRVMDSLGPNDHVSVVLERI